METLYISMVLMFGRTEIDNLCQNLFYTPHVNNERVIEVCEKNVWQESFPLSYND